MQLLSECKDKSGLDSMLLLKCRSAIKNIDASADVILYGSRARGDANPESDYDLLIITDKDVTLEREDIFRKQLFPIELETGYVLTVFLINREDWSSDIREHPELADNIPNNAVRER